jgi:carbonic anhydrase
MSTKSVKSNENQGDAKASCVLINSSLAALPVALGFVVQNLLVYGMLTHTSFFLLTSVILGVVLILLGHRIRPEIFRSGITAITIATQWFYTVWTVAALYAESITQESSFPQLILLALAVALIIFMFFRDLKSPDYVRFFSTLGVVLTALIIWNGIDVWIFQVQAMSAHAMLERKTKVAVTDLATKTGKSSQTPSQTGKPTHKSDLWSYQGETGPEMWGALNEEFKSCAVGLKQSPVDIPKHTKFSATKIKAQWRHEKGQVINDGHTVKVNLSGESVTKIGGGEYFLKQFHFHTPSEHQRSGFGYPMEIHFVHSSASGELAILSVLVEMGSKHSEFEKIMQSLPEHINTQIATSNAFNLKSFIPDQTEAFTYEGSFTTPPCSEGILWGVFAKTIELSSEQITAFRKLYSNNSRPIQPLGLRQFDTNEIQMAH